MEALFDVRVYSSRPHGRDDCHDIQGTGVAISTILDVGANDGVSAIKFRDAFPDATIHSFEPVTKTFEILKRKVATYTDIHCHQLAVGSRTRRGDDLSDRALHHELTGPARCAARR